MRPTPEGQTPLPLPDTERARNVRIGCAALAVVLIVGGAAVWFSQQRQTISAELLAHELDETRQHLADAEAQRDSLRAQLDARDASASDHTPGAPRPFLCVLERVDGDRLVSLLAGCASPDPPLAIREALQMHIRSRMSLRLGTSAETDASSSETIALAPGRYLLAAHGEAVWLLSDETAPRQLVAGESPLTWLCEAVRWYASPLRLHIADDAAGHAVTLWLEPVGE